MKNFSELEKKILNVFQNEGYSIRFINVEKANGIELTGIEVNDNDQIKPIVYLENYLDELEFMDLKTLARKIFNDFVVCKGKSEAVANQISSISNFDKIADKLHVKILSRALSAPYISKFASKDYLDLAYLVYFEIPLSDGKCGKITVTKFLLDIWKLTFSDVLERALKNEKFVFDSKDNIFTTDSNTEMYILSNSEYSYGASVIGNVDTLDQVSNQAGCDLLLLPSSVHEIIAIPFPEQFTNEDMLYFRRMVKEVNDMIVKENEILSYNLYCFIRDKKEVTII